MSTRKDFKRLIGYHVAKCNAPYTSAIGRRHAKGRAKGVGQWLKGSYIKSEVPLERVFVERK